MRNPRDGRFKSLAEGPPELLLRLIGLWEPGMEAQAIELLRELQLEAVQIDHAYRIGDAILHFEAISRWDARRVGTLALYRFLLRRKYKDCRVRSFLILMSEAHAPCELPERIWHEEDDGLQVSTLYQPIRLGEIDPALAFEPGCGSLLPWVPLLRGGVEELARARDAVARLTGVLPDERVTALAGCAT